MKHSTDQSIVKERMKATFQYRQNMIHDPDKSLNILDYFPRFLDTQGLINQDFTMLFGEEVSGKFIAKWPTFYKPRIIADCKNLRTGAHVDNLSSAQEMSDKDSKLTPERICRGCIASSGTDPRSASGTESTCTAQRIRST